nr:MAG TPA: hypothetical protein [Caudoviricetes sp.]
MDKKRSVRENASEVPYRHLIGQVKYNIWGLKGQ